MAGSGASGKWEASTIIEKSVEDLWIVGYLTADIAHRVPPRGQVIPVPKAGERVVFTSHFVRGLGFPLHPFVRGLLFFYGSISTI